MWTRRPAELVVLLVIVTLGWSCATTKTIENNARRVVSGQTLDTEGVKRAVAADTKDIEANLQQLRRKFEQALAKLRTDVEQRWGQKETRARTT